MSPVTLIISIVAYLALLFWIARIGDRRRFSMTGWARHPLVYTLALGVWQAIYLFEHRHAVHERRLVVTVF